MERRRCRNDIRFAWLGGKAVARSRSRLRRNSAQPGSRRERFSGVPPAIQPRRTLMERSKDLKLTDANGKVGRLPPCTLSFLARLKSAECDSFLGATLNRSDGE